MHENTRRALRLKGAWNKGLLAKDYPSLQKALDAAHQAARGRTPWNKNKRYGKSNWIRLNGKHDYRNLHKRIQRRFGKANFCEHCHTSNGLYEWANISNKYDEYDRSDWMTLCHTCHVRYDKNKYEKRMV